MKALFSVRERLFNAGYDTVGNTPEEYAAVINTGIARTLKVIKEANLKID